MIVDGVELLRMIKDKEFKDKDIIVDMKTSNIFKYNKNVDTFYNKEVEMFDCYYLFEFVTSKFEIIENEEDKEIDIDSIEELYTNDIKSVGESEIKCWTGRNLDIAFANKINELIKAIKQLNKKIGE